MRPTHQELLAAVGKTVITHGSQRAGDRPCNSRGGWARVVKGQESGEMWARSLLWFLQEGMGARASDCLV